MPSRPLLLIYPPSLQSHDGTTVQLRRLLSDFSVPVWHIHGRTPASFTDQPANCFSLEIALEPPYRFRRGAGFLRRSWRRWVVPQLVRSQLRRAMKRSGLPAARAAYVIVYDELNAIFATHALKAAGIKSYVLHLMDLFHGQFDAKHQPVLAELISKAQRVLVVSSRLGDEIASVAKSPVEVMPLATGYETPREMRRSDKRYLVATGALYAASPRKLEYLESVVIPTWTEFARTTGNVDWLYSGADGRSLSKNAKSFVKDCGMLEHKAWCELLAGARCAIVPVVHHADDHYRFSVPSRIVDYLSAGLPVISPRCPGTATGDFLEGLERRGVLLASSPSELREAFQSLFCDEDFHREQVNYALEAARSFTLNECRNRLQGIIQSLES